MWQGDFLGGNVNIPLLHGRPLPVIPGLNLIRQDDHKGKCRPSHRCPTYQLRYLPRASRLACLFPSQDPLILQDLSASPWNWPLGSPNYVIGGR